MDGQQTVAEFVERHDRGTTRVQTARSRLRGRRTGKGRERVDRLRHLSCGPRYRRRRDRRRPVRAVRAGRLLEIDAEEALEEALEKYENGLIRPIRPGQGVIEKSVIEWRRSRPRVSSRQPHGRHRGVLRARRHRVATLRGHKRRVPRPARSVPRVGERRRRRGSSPWIRVRSVPGLSTITALESTPAASAISRSTVRVRSYSRPTTSSGTASRRAQSARL